MVVSDPLKYTVYVRPVCLPSKDFVIARSWGFACEKLPDVYTDVPEYIDWIMEEGVFKLFIFILNIIIIANLT